LNQSFDLAEWASMDEFKSLPMQVLWSGSWSQEWDKEGKRVAEAVSQAKFINHSGGRWPQVISRFQYFYELSFFPLVFKNIVFCLIF
jgi:hypothetical protein